MKTVNKLRLLSPVATLTAAMNTFSADSPTPANYSPHVDNSFPSAVFFGDTHVHTDNSMDAGAFGNRLGVNATYLNSIGNTMLNAYWQDPEFNPEQRAFYYARVLEIPTRRWTTYDAVRFGVEPPKDVPAAQQDRAYTSPIWYTPAKL